MQKKKSKTKKKYQRPILKVIRFKDINLKPAMAIFWSGLGMNTTGSPCEEF